MTYETITFMMEVHPVLSTFWLFMICCGVACIGGSR